MTASRLEHRLFSVETGIGETRHLALSGRNRWALETLIAAGKRGCTPINQPAPRWSAYAHNLRKMGVPIFTIFDNHGGPFAGHHARYVLTGAVESGEVRP